VRGLRGAGGVPDVTAGAVALVDQPLLGEPFQGDRVPVDGLRLAGDHTVPGHADGFEVLQLAVRGDRRGPLRVDVVDPQHEAASGRARPRLREDRGPQIAEVEVPAGAGGVAAVTG
jgi:hypothetical protein